MSASRRLIVLDTGVLIHALRDSELWKRIEAEHSLLSRQDRPLLPVVCVGEVLAIGRMNNWGQGKLLALEALLGQLTLVDINSKPVLERYAEIKTFLRTKAMPHNDVWIAAITSVAEAHLLTCDTDFDRLEGEFSITRTYYDPKWRPKL